jgi:CheY-like chemotaxis protein
VTGAARVLLVTLFDDERAIYSDCLCADGYDVVVADGPEHALELASTADIVVTRILQPGRSMNGIELLRRLKQDPTSSHVPVIVITSLMQPEFRAEATAAGCDGYLLLPVLPDVLLSEIRRVLCATERTVA